MTREEAKIVCQNIENGKHNNGFSSYFIDEIYNDFENRTCKNCKYYLEDSSCNLMDNEQIHEKLNIFHRMLVEKNFGCNNWKKI